jgi:hypothetical protein
MQLQERIIDQPENVYTYRGEKLGEGNDFEVYDFTDGYVV